MDTTNRIQFEKPNIPELIRQYTVVDLHFHTHYSDGNNSIEEIAEQAGKLGIGVAITDHNEIKGAVEIDSYKDVLSIPGIEITSKEGTHILVYFYDVKSLKRFYKNDVKPFLGDTVMSSTSLKMEEIIKRARAFKTVTVFPHPYSPVFTGIHNSYFPQERLDQLFKMIDGVEVINSGNLKKSNLKCALLGFNLNKAIAGGSDGHTLVYLGKVVCYARCKNSRKAFLDAVRKKQNKVIGREVNMLRKVTSNGRKMRTNLKNYPDLVEKNLKYGYTVINLKSKRLKDNVKRRINGKISKII
ncbi:MAG: PHP domain-containing protein [Deltaproteobacteria bacterium]|nr:PHP domain-containing protein [Deltaproteobacteria bacterium]